MLKQKYRKVIIILGIVLLLLVLFGIKLLFFNKKYVPYYTPNSRSKQVDTFVMEGNDVEDFDVYGWIQVQGTNIDVPLLSYSVFARISNISFSWRSNKYVEGENRESIHGHNIQNVSSTPLVNQDWFMDFEDLMSFVYEDFAKENLYIAYTYGGEEHLYKIYGVGFYNDFSSKSYSDKNDIENYIKEVKENSIYDYDVDVKTSDHLISLTTCTRYFGLDGKTNFRVDAREVRKKEKIGKYHVETNKNYDIIK